MELMRERLSLFRRDGLLDIGSRILWYMWDRDPELDGGNYVTRAYTPLLISLAAMFGGGQSLPRPSEQEFRLLCWELHQCPQGTRLDSPAGYLAVSAVQRAASKLPQESRLRKLRRDSLGAAWVECAIGLVVQTQQRPFSYRASDLVRLFLIYDELRKIPTGNGLATFERLEAAFLGTEWSRFQRGLLVLLAVSNVDALGTTTPGRIDLVDLGEQPEAPLGVQVRDLKIIVDRLGTNITQFREYASEMLAAPSAERKFHALVRRLCTHPIVRLDDCADQECAISIPSPWHLRMALTDFLMNGTITFLAENDRAASIGYDPFSLRGAAYHRYLSRALSPFPAVVDLDRHPATDSSKPHPDFLWIGERFAFLIEAKIRLSPNSDQTGESATSIFESWRRAELALNQCTSYLSRHCDGLCDGARGREWIVLLLTPQPSAGEITGARSAAKRWNWLSGTGVRAMALLAPADLEHYVLEDDPDGLGEAVVAMWDRLDPYSLRRPAETPDYDETRVVPAIDDGWRRLFPGIPPPWQS